MGSDLYASVWAQHGDFPGSQRFPMFEGPSTSLARGIVVDAFGDCHDRATDPRTGYLTEAEWREQRTHRRCPWVEDEPYWVRKIPGAEFAAIVREKRWQKLQDGDFADLECPPELRALAALVQSLVDDGCDVVVYCWHSQ
jgi:hypothetical protein